MTSDDADPAGRADRRPRLPRPGHGSDLPSSVALTELVDRSVDGDQRALTEVLRILRPLVVRYCRSRLGEYERVNVSADDVAQEVCLAVLRALPTYQDQGRPFLAFVYGIAQHKVVDGHRSAMRNRSIPFSTLPDTRLVSDFADEPWPSTQLEAELGLDIDEDESAVSALLSELPDLEREVVRLSVVAGLGHERAAEALGIAPATALDAQRNALEELRGRLEERQDEDELRAFDERDWEEGPVTGFADLDALLHSADENVQRLLPEAQRGPSIYRPWKSAQSASAERLLKDLSDPTRHDLPGYATAIRRTFDESTEVAQIELSNWIDRLESGGGRSRVLGQARMLREAITRRNRQEARTYWKRVISMLKHGGEVPPRDPNLLDDFAVLYGE